MILLFSLNCEVEVHGGELQVETVVDVSCTARAVKLRSMAMNCKVPARFGTAKVHAARFFAAKVHAARFFVLKYTLRGSLC